ncbi:TetR/AcrR family transcriptional regulator [Paenibacillus sp. TAB 01]|uniref:TetR/AcrR family transcriptional regulator n=1 Tax=Paenibacillus sp. TAB 01 TaxID=3368988 RepID=UPI0037532032
MEDMKKSKILDTAMDLFRMKGYTAASMQDIAEACGMAKASIYKFFASKEDLFTAAFVACHQTLLDQAAALDRLGNELNWPPKEKLRRKIELQLQYTVDNHLFMIDFKELPITANDNFITAWKRKKAALQAWRHELLIDAYGERIEPYVWDVVAIFRGIHIEYLNYVQQKVIALPMSELAAFLADRMDALTEELIRSSPKPVIDGRNIYFNYLNPSDPPVRQATVEQLIEMMSDKIGQLSKPDSERKELQKVAAMLGEECGRPSPDATLIRVFTTYLDLIPELRSHLRQLHFLLS